ncbi:signal peptidase II [Hasllibacter sp. MH4015]|uniref:signal peptidase II n=1 Tax=Hasllibacter sp. MH4015 TaxID=2854029 RepID=UPI001CD1D00B|nr:signal peptidase II [Hasllibacter sp. MH4015]
MRLFYLSAIIWFALDQGSKYGVLYGLNLLERLHIEVIPGMLNFHLGWNTGINFGLFGGGPEVMRWILVGLAAIIVGWLWYWARTGLTRPIALVCAGAVIGGALGNSLDRIIHGAVIDFLNVSCCGINNPFAFNVADIGIFAGAIGLVIFADSHKEPA